MLFSCHLCHCVNQCGNGRRILSFGEATHPLAENSSTITGRRCCRCKLLSSRTRAWYPGMWVFGIMLCVQCSAFLFNFILCYFFSCLCAPVLSDCKPCWTRGDVTYEFAIIWAVQRYIVTASRVKIWHPWRNACLSSAENTTNRLFSAPENVLWFFVCFLLASLFFLTLFFYKYRVCEFHRWWLVHVSVSILRCLN